MREFVFEIGYEQGVDEFIDVHIETPELRSTALLCSMTEDEFWRLDRLDGPASAVERAKTQLTAAPHGRSMSDQPCDGDTYVHVLEDTTDGCVVYTHSQCDGRCDAVPLVANRYLSGALLFEVRRSDDTERWRILMQDDKNVGLLYDTLGGILRNGLSFHFGHLGDVETPPANPLAAVSIPSEQRRTLEVAAQEGYYETPRETTLEEVAERLDCPRSTVSYRLRRAEAKLANGYLSAT
jgi:predicted DNA binding protein